MLRFFRQELHYFISIAYIIHQRYFITYSLSEKSRMIFEFRTNSIYFFLGPPVIRSTPTVKAIEGQRLQVSCPASGYPIEQITWQKGNISMLPFNRYSVVYLY